VPELQENIRNLPTALIIFGATGDLSRKRIFPSLFRLNNAGLLPEIIKIIATARSKHSPEEFRDIVKGIVNAKNEVHHWENFSKKIDYISADVAENLNLKEISKILEEFEENSKTCAKRIFYMAIAPDIFQKSVESLGKSKLYLGCQKHNNKPRIIIEKPFGYDLASARTLANSLSKFFKEEQIYRMDHYLGKETAQNIFALRFGNEIFKPIWNKDYIDHIQITTAEEIGVEKRGAFYDKVGTLRDFTQSHLLQLLSLVTAEEPEKFEAKYIRQKKLAMISSIKKLREEEVTKFTVRGQYEGYLKEENVNPNSQTESYAQVKLFIDHPTWQGVPFYLRTGKKLQGKVTSIILELREKKHKIFENFWQNPTPNHITIQMQPTEGIGVRLAAKKPGLTTQLEPVDMEFCYKTSSDIPKPDAYERLLLDIILDDQSLFISQDEVEESWKVIDPIRKVWDHGKPKLETYKPGSWGPEAADKLVEKDGRRWLAPILTICKI